MTMTKKVGAVALLMSLTMIDQAFAGFFEVTVPELDGPSGIAAIALLASVGALLFGGSRKKDD
jgi:hypothetical protein